LYSDEKQFGGKTLGSRRSMFTGIIRNSKAKTGGKEEGESGGRK